MASGKGSAEGRVKGDAAPGETRGGKGAKGDVAEEAPEAGALAVLVGCARPAAGVREIEDPPGGAAGGADPEGNEAGVGFPPEGVEPEGLLEMAPKFAA